MLHSGCVVGARMTMQWDLFSVGFCLCLHGRAMIVVGACKSMQWVCLVPALPCGPTFHSGYMGARTAVRAKNEMKGNNKYGIKKNIIIVGCKRTNKQK